MLGVGRLCSAQLPECVGLYGAISGDDLGACMWIAGFSEAFRCVRDLSCYMGTL